MEKFSEWWKIIWGGEKSTHIFPVSCIRESHVNKLSHCMWFRIVYFASRHTSDKDFILYIIKLIRCQLELK